jgi:hypothetical protein
LSVESASVKGDAKGLTHALAGVPFFHGFDIRFSCLRPISGPFEE